MKTHSEFTEQVLSYIKDNRYVVLSGLIGVGKSTLTKAIAELPGFIPFYELPDENPYLPDYYAGKQVSFPMQQYFIAQFLQHAGSIKQYIGQGHRIIQDRSAYEVYEIFCRHQYANGLLSDIEFETQTKMSLAAYELMPKPDLIIYLDAPTETIMGRIAHRNRPYEKSIDNTFLDQIRSLYEDWLKSLIANGAYLEGSASTPRQGKWAGTKIAKLNADDHTL